MQTRKHKPLDDPILRMAKHEPKLLRLAEYPQLRLISWNRGAEDLVREDEAFALYERNWRFVDDATLSDEERRLIARLTREYGHGVLHV